MDVINISKKLFAIIFVVVAVSCNKHNKGKTIIDLNPSDKHELYAEKDAFFPDYTLGNVKSDTLYLNVMLDDCGEWGGPEEEIKIYVAPDRVYQLEYKKFRFNCDSLSFYYDKEPPLDFKKTIALDEQGKTHVSAFFTDLMKAKISESTFSNAGCIYSLFNRDSTLYLHIYTGRKTIKEKYLEFRNKLHLNK